MMLLSSDDKEVFFEGKEVQEKASSLGWRGLNDEFSDFPLAEPNLNLSLVVVPDDQITSGDDYIENASFDTENMGVTEATFDDGESRPILIGGTINIELLIPQSIYDNGTFAL